jgi:hypothetical protein
MNGKVMKESDDSRRYKCAVCGKHNAQVSLHFAGRVFAELKKRAKEPGAKPSS